MPALTESRASLFAPGGLVPSPGSHPLSHADALRSRASFVDSLCHDIGNEPDDQMSLTHFTGAP